VCAFFLLLTVDLLTFSGLSQDSEVLRLRSPTCVLSVSRSRVLCPMSWPHVLVSVSGVTLCPWQRQQFYLLNLALVCHLFTCLPQQHTSWSKCPPHGSTSDSSSISLVLAPIWPDFCCCHFDADVGVAAKDFDVAAPGFYFVAWGIVHCGSTWLGWRSAAVNK